MNMEVNRQEDKQFGVNCYSTVVQTGTNHNDDDEESGVPLSELIAHEGDLERSITMHDESNPDEKSIEPNHTDNNHPRFVMFSKADYFSVFNGNEWIKLSPSSSSLASIFFTVISNVQIFVFGQCISLLATAAGAAQSTLKLDCDFNAPTISLTPFFLALSFGLLPLYYLSRNAKSSISAEQLEPAENFPEKLKGAYPDDSTSEESGATSITTEDQHYSVHCTNYIRRSCFSGLIPLSQPLHVYFLVALGDFYANYFTVLAYRYTSITSVALSDAFALPTAMLLSRLWLKHQYSALHGLGVIICIAGIFLNFYQDYQTDHEHESNAYNSTGGNSKVYPEVPNEEDGGRYLSLNGGGTMDKRQDYPHKALGDLLGLLGGILYGVSNTVAEYLLCHPNAPNETIANLEYLSLVGFFGLLICLVHVVLFEMSQFHEILDVLFSSSGMNNENNVNSNQSLLPPGNATVQYSQDASFDSDQCTTNKFVALWTAFSLCWFLFYVCSARFLQVSEAVYYNLSLTTDDFWCTGFSLLAQHIRPMPLFYPSLALILGGTVLYEMAPSSPKVDNGEGIIYDDDNNEEEDVHDDRQHLDLITIQSSQESIREFQD